MQQLELGLGPLQLLLQGQAETRAMIYFELGWGQSQSWRVGRGREQVSGAEVVVGGGSRVNKWWEGQVLGYRLSGGEAGTKVT